MKHSFLLASFFTLLFTFAIHTADARSGCCSHHGGVCGCGCGCCDGSSLSAICAPYYPECSNTGNNAGVNTAQPTQASAPTATQVRAFYSPRPTATPTLTSTPTPTRTPTPQPTKKTDKVQVQP